MVPHGRGRGIRKVQDGEKPVGLVRSNTDLRASDQDGQRVCDDRFRDDARSEDTKSPGEESPIPPNLNTDDLVRLIEVGKDMRMITKCIKHLCSSEQALRQVVEEIHKISSKDKNFGRNAAKAFSNVSQLEVCGIKFRDVVLRCIQNDFKNREDIRGEGEDGYLLAVNLLCEVFHNMRLADGTVINVLSVPILEYFNALLVDPSEEAVDLISTQTHIIGEEVQRSKPEKFADFLLKVRKLIVDPNNGLSEKSRCGLLHILESHLLRWPTVLPEKIGEFYSGILGERVLTRVISYPHVPPHNRPNSQDGSQHSSQHEDDLGRPSSARRIAHADPIPRAQPYFRPQPGPSPAPRIFDTPPPNMLPNFVPPPAAAHQPGIPPPHQQQPVWAGPPRKGYQDSPPLKDVERIAADMMAIRLPNAQISPPIRTNARSPGWQAMPSILPSGPPPNVPTAIVPPGVPPHNHPVYRDNQPSRPSPHSPNWNSAPPTIPSANAPPSNMTRDPPYAGRTNGREYFDGYNRPGGSGRIISGSGNHWKPAEAGSNEWKGGSGYSTADGNHRQEFDIGTWENPGSGGGGSRGSQDGSRAGGGSTSWSTNDGTSSWGDRDEGNSWGGGGGGQKKWSDDGVGSSSGRGWGDAVTSSESSSNWAGGGGGNGIAGSRHDPEIGHWGDANVGGSGDSVTAADKKDWRNDSTESSSPGWKKDTINLGNWADLVPSPRSDLEDNPLNNSTEAVRNIVW